MLNQTSFCHVKCNRICKVYVSFVALCKYREYNVLPSLGAEEVWEALQKKHHPLMFINIGIDISTILKQKQKSIIFILVFTLPIVITELKDVYLASKTLF